MTPEKQAVLDALTAERYGPSLWFTRRPPKQQSALVAFMDDEVTRARRRAELAEAFEHGEETA